MAKPAKRQHFLARFYLRNFAEPMFSDNLCVYDMRKQRWEKRSPYGVGWFPHLCSMTDMKGNRTDEFDQFLKRHVEDSAAPALKKLATGEELDADERSSVALFIALTAARCPGLLGSVLEEHLDRLRLADRTRLDDLVRLWCDQIGMPYASYSHTEFLKPSTFGAMWKWALILQDQLLGWEWHLISTARERPYVTSDRPVFAQWEPKQNLRLVSFPVSSLIMLIVIAGGQFNEARHRTNDVIVGNRQTMHRASEFVIACSESFPGNDFLVNNNGGRAAR
jgi:hypothetical protein